MSETKLIEVLNFGAGVQSTTILLMSLRGILPKLDHVVFADTQWEPAAVYRHLEWCKEQAAKGGLSIEVRTAGNLRDNLLIAWGGKIGDGSRKIKAAIPAYVRSKNGSRGILRRQCTATYKIDVIEKFIRSEILRLKPRQWWPKVATVRQWIGISCDELQRMKKPLSAWQAFWHPLIEADALQHVPKGNLRGITRGFTREDCLAWLAKEGYPTPPRSACVGCPFRRNKEWLVLTRDEFADACEVDRLIRIHDGMKLRGKPYLHDSLMPLAEVDLGGVNTEWNSWDNECDGVCGV